MVSRRDFFMGAGALAVGAGVVSRVNGSGGRAAYRGDKITKRVWLEILAGHDVAQGTLTPGDHVTGSREAPAIPKFGLRSFPYDGQVQ